jgi:hypothetical protein
MAIYEVYPLDSNSVFRLFMKGLPDQQDVTMYATKMWEAHAYAAHFSRHESRVYVKVDYNESPESKEPSWYIDSVFVGGRKVYD